MQIKNGLIKLNLSDRLFKSRLALSNRFALPTP